jgi:hypothetical protein
MSAVREFVEDFSSGVSRQKRARIAFHIEIIVSLECRFVEKPFQALQHQLLLAAIGGTGPTAASVRPFAYL